MRILEKSCGEFVKTRNALDRMLCVLQESVGAERKWSDIFTPELENRLWSTQVLGMHSSESLLNAVFYLNGKGLCLRGVQEHHNLRFSQFVREENPPRFIMLSVVKKTTAVVCPMWVRIKWFQFILFMRLVKEITFLC